jgi:hypothetical protein
MYDGVVKMSDAPLVSGCSVMQIGRSKTCECTDQQGNPLELEHRQCMLYFDAGSFNPKGEARYPVIPPYVPNLPGPSGGGESSPVQTASTSEPRGSG